MPQSTSRIQRSGSAGSQRRRSRPLTNGRISAAAAGSASSSQSRAARSRTNARLQPVTTPRDGRPVTTSPSAGHNRASDSSSSRSLRRVDVPGVGPPALARMRRADPGELDARARGEPRGLDRRVDRRANRARTDAGKRVGVAEQRGAAEIDHASDAVLIGEVVAQRAAVGDGEPLVRGDQAEPPSPGRASRARARRSKHRDRRRRRDWRTGGAAASAR